MVPEQMVDEPEIELGVEGMPLTTFTVNVCAVEEPHALLAVIVMSPEVRDEVASIEFVVDVPLQPEGKVHV